MDSIAEINTLNRLVNDAIKQQHNASQQVEQLIEDMGDKVSNNAEQGTQATQVSNQIMTVVDDFKGLSNWFKTKH